VGRKGEKAMGTATAILFNNKVRKLVRHILPLVENAMRGEAEARIRLEECLMFLEILSPDIRRHLLGEEEVEGLLAIAEHLRDERMSFIEGRNKLSKMINKVVHVLEGGDWVWVPGSSMGNHESLLGRVESVDHVGKYAHVRVGRSDLATDRGYRAMTVQIPLSEIEGIEENPGDSGKMAWFLETSMVA